MTQPETPQRPNIVFFMVDQLSAKWLAATRKGVCPTPNIDRLAERGVRSINAISSNPVCCPTRATIATGLPTRGHGVLENGYDLDPALPTFMQALQRGGLAYRGIWESAFSATLCRTLSRLPSLRFRRDTYD